jgi:ABC-type Fe3+-siderophore transport system permease subunit
MLVYLGQLRGRPQAPYIFLAWGAAVAALRLAMLHEAVGHMLAGHAWAQQRGIHAQRTRVRVYGAVCLLVACAALAAGHVFGLCLLAVAAARRSVGDLPRRLWPMAALCGAILAVWVDLACVALAAGSAPLPAAAVLAPLTLAAAVWAAPDDASIGPGCAPQLHRGHSR